MPRPSRFNVLARLLPRTRNPVIGQLFTHVLNQPLLVEPAIGERLLGAYMQGDQDVVYSGGPVVENAGKVAIINISGALASRPMPGPSGDGPQCYEMILEDFDDALADSTVAAIILRLDSPGGFVAGCFDLTDYIFESRGQKPIIAVVDDMAYSAAYAIAAACDEIYVTRTGGVGSVGVVAYHLDQSAYDKNLGVKVTAIFAGAHKNDFTPHEPLSDAAREREQAEVDRLYTLFAETVARYRGMKVDAVKATEALTFNGPEALKAGFADRLGTLDDAIAALTEQPESAEQRTKREAAEAEDRRKAEAEVTLREQQRVRGAVSALVSATDLPANVKQALLAGELSEIDVEGRVAHARQVIDKCKVAKLDDWAERFVKRNTPLEQVTEELLEHKAASDREKQVDITIPSGASGGGNRVPGVWDSTIRKFGGTPK